MPQLDVFLFLSQLMWLMVLFFSFYLFFSEWSLPQMYEWMYVKDRLESKKKMEVKEEILFSFQLSFTSTVFPKEVSQGLSMKLKK